MGLESIFGGIAGAIGGYKSTKATNEMNYKMFKEQLEYDKPVNQVARLNEAGLNPNLVYGSGIQNMQTAGKQPEMKNPFDKVINGLQVSLLGSQVKKAKADAKQAEANAALAGTNSVMAKLTAPYSLVRIQEDIVRTMLNNSRAGFDNWLIKAGISPSTDRGVAAQIGRMVTGGVLRFIDVLQRGINNTSRRHPSNAYNSNPVYGNFEGIGIRDSIGTDTEWTYGNTYR